MKINTETLLKQLHLCVSALREISKSTYTVEGDYTFNQMYKSPTNDAYIAKEALRKLKGVK